MNNLKKYLNEFIDKNKGNKYVNWNESSQRIRIGTKLSCINIFKPNNSFHFVFNRGTEKSREFQIRYLKNIKSRDYSWTERVFGRKGEYTIDGSFVGYYSSEFTHTKVLIEELKNIVSKSLNELKKTEKLKKEEERLKKELLEKRKQESLIREKKERERISKEREDRIKYLLKERDETIHNLDKDNNGLVDVLEVDDFMKLLKKHQEKIIKINPGHITDFVKISEHLSLKKDNIQIIFDRLRNTVDLQIEGLLELLNNQINIFNVLLFHSINMIGLLINNDLITYNEIYLKFDKLDVFNSNWENQVQSELISVNKGLVDVKNKLSEISKGVNTMNKNFRQLIFNVHQMEKNITSELSNLSYTIDYGVSELNSSLTRELKDINSGIGMNNLLTGIQTYQMYKINKNTKSLRG